MGCFEKSADGTELRQGEILTGVTQFDYDSKSETALSSAQPYVIIVNQDCDLLRDFENVRDGKPNELNGVLFLPLLTETDIRGRQAINTSIWREIKSHRHERYHLLPEILLEQDALRMGIPVLVADFRQMFTQPPAEVAQQIVQDSAHRRGRLISPYREHFQSRCSFYLQRVALPD